jgi:hypothetical protein
MLSDRLTLEGTEILNQHCTVRALVVVFQLSPPVESAMPTPALPEKVPARAEDRGQRTEDRGQRTEDRRQQAGSSWSADIPVRF